MNIKEQYTIEKLEHIIALASSTINTLKKVDENTAESVQCEMNSTFSQLRQDLVESNMKLAKIKSICEDPNTDDYFALGQIMDIVGTKP